MRKALTLLVLAVSLFSSALSAAEWGDLKLTFVYDGAVPAPQPISVTKDPQFCGKFDLVDEELVVNKENKGIANIVAYMYTRGDSAPPIHPDYAAQAEAKFSLDNNSCRFEPHVVLLTTTQTLVLKNSDGVGHNTNYAGFRNPAFNDVIPPGGTLEKKLTVGGERAKVSCGIHPWMSAYVVVHDTPYGAVSDQNGELLIKNVPVGTWTFQLWHGGSGGYVADVKQNGKATTWAKGRLEVTIKPGMNDLGEIKYKPKATR
ncbi:MAG: methylamine utilization protein [Planctomycetota bacterium]|nr:methylamine utilization protein [Planctomycetota bacterium]